MGEYRIRPFSTIRGTEKIRGMFYRPEIPGPFPCLVICPSLFESQFDYMYIAALAAENEIAAIVFDYIGGSVDSRSDGLIFDLSVATQIADIKEVIDEALRLEDISNVFLLGIDEGGLAAAIAGTQMKEDVGAMIFFYPAFNLPEDVRKQFKNKKAIPRTSKMFGYPVGDKFYETLFDIEWEEAISGYNKPVLIFHGSKDLEVPVEYSREAIVVFKRGQIVELKEETHSFSEKQFNEAIMISLKFVEFCNSLEELLTLHRQRRKIR